MGGYQRHSDRHTAVLVHAQLYDPVAQRGRGGIRVEQRGVRGVERGGDAHREIALVFEDVEIVVDADPRQLDQLVTEMYRLGGGAPRGEQPDDFRHVALIGGRVSSHQQSDAHSISSPRSTASGGQLTAAPGRYNLVSDGQVPYQQ